MPRTIFIVEDDPDQRQNCTDALRRRGYTVAAYASRAEALRAFAKTKPDLAILDIMLGDEIDGGFDLCREMLAVHPDLPVIFLTSRVDDIDRISGLRLGAWDYQAKPVSLAFLAERVSSLFRILELKGSAQGGERQRLRVGDLEIDEERMQVSWKDRPVDLTYTQFNVILEIVRKRDGRGASYDDLARATRQGVVENNTINTHILHARVKFREIDPGFDCIKSVYGFGYRWSCS